VTNLLKIFKKKIPDDHDESLKQDKPKTKKDELEDEPKQFLIDAILEVWKFNSPLHDIVARINFLLYKNNIVIEDHIKILNMQKNRLYILYIIKYRLHLFKKKKMIYPNY
jgi:hypothetical protein